MKLNNLSRLTALLLALTIFMTSVAFADPVAVSDYTADDYASQLQAAYIAAYAYDGTADVGKYAKFAESEDFIFVYDNDPNLSDDAYSFAYEEFLEDTIVRITDWAWMSSTSALLYKVEFYRGGVIEEAAEYWPAEAWVLQCYTDSNEFASLEFVTICEDCGEPDCNINHNPPDTEAVIPETPTLTEGEDVSLVDANGEPITEDEILRIKEGTKYSLSAWTGLEDKGDETYQWQISAEETGGAWVNISGQTSKGLLTSLAMFEAAFKTVPYIRCKITTGGQTLYSQAIPVAALAEATLTDSNSDVSVAGLLPLDATLNVTSTSLEETGLDNGAYPVGEASLFSDVTLYRAGSTYQPEEDETVTVTFPEASVTEAGLSAGDGYHIYHIHDGAVDISGIQQYNGGDIAMTFGSLSVVGISEATEVEKDLVEQHGEIVSEESVSLTLYFNSDSVVLYDNPEATGTATLYVTTVTGYSGAPVEAWQKITYTDNTVVYRIRDSADTPEELRTTITAYPIVYATDVSAEIITDDPIMITKCAICGTENCTKQHLYCEEHSKFDCTENHEKAEPTKPLTGAVIPENLTFTPDADVCIADAKGNKVTSSFELPAGTQASLSAWPAGDAYQWQIKDKDGNWMDIRGKDQRGLLFSGALFADANAQPVIRCEVTVGGEVKHSAEIRVNVTTPAAEASLFSVARAADPVVTAEGDNLREYTVVINYVFENNEVVAEPYTATLAAGSNWPATVKNPTVMGYLPYVGNATEPSESVELNITNIQADVTYTVTYKPTNVNYTVIHYWQNVDNDNFTEHERETLQGLTGSTVPEVANTYPGMYALLYEKPAIAADGSTVVEVYYDRNYYLMLFDLGEGGYGVEPIYARYEAPVTVGTPTRPGYIFNGWSPAVPTTVPVDGGTYTAQWTAADTAKVKVVIWGENPNDEEYSYLSTGELMLKPGTEYTYNGTDQLYLYCEKEEHTHTTECGLVCGKEEHTQHTDDCLTCNVVSHSHGIDCWDVDGAAFSTEWDEHWVEGTEANGSIGESYYWAFGNNATGKKYIYIAGTWYKYTGDAAIGSTVNPTCGKQEVTHDHTDSCYGCEVHSHIATCYGCGKEEHTHTTTGANPCTGTVDGLDNTLWTFVKSDTVTVNPDGSTVINVYYDRVSYSVQFYSDSDCRDSDEYTSIRITAKWGQNIVDKWPTYNGSSSWYVPNKENTWQNGIQVMPVGGAKFWGPKTGNSSYTAYYYVEALPGATDTIEHNGVKYVLHHTDTSSSSGNVTSEEKYAIEGFTYKEGTANGSSYSNAKFYYTRHRYAIEFYSPTTLLKTETGVPYQSPLSSYAWTPDASMAPTQYEPGSVEFEGWYLNPECTGDKFDFTTHTMPAGTNDGDTTLTLYANWVPVNRTVEFFLDYDEYVANNSSITGTHPTLTVPHGSKVETVPATPTNGDYTFVGWFYMDGDVEKAFDFANMPITKDLQVYGKWSSNVLKEYIVYFKIQGTDTQIAAPITGSTLAGETKTFDAKGDEELDPDYRAGYFPLVKSHSFTLLMDQKEDTDNSTEWYMVDGKLIQGYTFWYVQKAAVPYTVYYVAETLKEGEATEGKETILRDGKTYYIIADTKTDPNNRKAVVTEQFKAVTGYMPDAYQKRLVVVDGAVNEIIFYYTVDTEHAYYKITHYTQNTDGVNWTEYKSSQAPGDIGQTYTADPLTIDGFTYDRTEYLVGQEVVDANHQLTADGLQINLYYTRNSYPYVVRYWEEGTGEELAPDKTTNDKGEKLTGLYGAVVSESAIVIPGYTAVAPTSQTLTIRIEEDEDGKPLTTPTLNIITFYYTEDEVTINYVPVTANGDVLKLNDTTGGTVNPTFEKLGVVTGIAKGSTATAKENYTFVGWYTDATCTTAVTESDGSIESTKFTPEKSGDLWTEKTYYAKFAENETTITYKAAYKDGTEIKLGATGGTVDVANNDVGAGAQDSENVLVVTGEAIGATATANATYKFVGWYSDANCTEQVGDAEKYGPTKAEGTVWPDGTTYYALFELNVGELAITKNVNYPTGYSKESFPNDVFTFTVTLGDTTINGEYGDATFENGVATITLKAGETATISNLVHGTTYTVEESSMPDGYFYEEKTKDGSIQAGEEPVTATFTNEYKVGSLTISKAVVGEASVVPGDEFEFTVQLSNKQDEYSFTGSKEGTISLTNNTVRLKDGESITITGIPLGTDFTVTETENSNYTQSPDKVQGEIGTDSKAEFTNTYLLGDLQITKKVSGDKAPSSSEFTFTIELTNVDNSSANAKYGEVQFVDGKATVTLSAGESIKIKGLPGSISYKVTEAYVLGYTPDEETKAGVIEAGKLNAVEFTNTYKTGNLMITKAVVGETAPDTHSFTIKVKLTDAENNLLTGEVKYSIDDGSDSTTTLSEGILTLTLMKGQKVTIIDLPDGTKYEVAEEPFEGYTTSYDEAQTGSISPTGANTTVTNTYTKGDLQITKQVVKNTGFTPTVSEFVIQVELTGTNLNTAGYTVEGLATGKTVNWSGSATKLTAQIPVTATLGTPATVTIKHLPAGTEYTVTENAPVGFTDSIETTADNTTNKIDAGKMDAVTVTNTYKVGSLKVAKTVVGEVTEAYPSVFNFTLELSDDVPVENCKIQIANGDQSEMDANGQFTLVAGQTALITGIPDGVTYTVTESSDNITDYFTTTVAVDSGTATTAYVGSGTMNAATNTADAPATVAFVNTAKTSKLTVVKTGMSAGESAIVNVKVGDETYMVALNGTSSTAVITNLPIGAGYSATETDWSWRYTKNDIDYSDTEQKINKEGSSTITVKNSSNGDKWLHDEDSKTNIFGTN